MRSDAQNPDRDNQLEKALEEVKNKLRKERFSCPFFADCVKV